MLRPCLICDDGHSLHFQKINGQDISDFPSLPELAVALFQRETTHALEALTENYQLVEAHREDNGWDKFCAMSSRDAVDYLIELLPEIVDTYEWLFRDNKLYQQNARPAIDQIVCRFAFQVQSLDEKFGVRYSKTKSCPIWLRTNSPVRHIHAATDFTMKWSDGSRISVISGTTYASLCDHLNHQPDGLYVEVEKLGTNATADQKYAEDIRQHLDYSTNGRSLNPVYNPPVLEYFTGVLAEWVKENTTLGIDFWHEQLEIYHDIFLPTLDELIAADERLRQAEETPMLVERYSKAKLNYALVRLKAEVLLESYQAYFRRVEHDTCHIINGYYYYPRFIGDDLFYDGHRSGGDNQAPLTEYDDRPFRARLDEFDQHVWFSKARNPAPGVIYDVCFGFTSDHSGFQLTLPNRQRELEYEFYNWQEYDELTVYGEEQMSIYTGLQISEFSPYMVKTCLPAGLQVKQDEFKDFHL